MLEFIFESENFNVFMETKSAFMKTDIEVGFAPMVKIDDSHNMVLAVFPKTEEELEDAIDIIEDLTFSFNEDIDFEEIEDLIYENYELTEVDPSKLYVSNPQKYMKGKKKFLHDYEGYFVTPGEMFVKGPGPKGYYGSLVQVKGNKGGSKHKHMVKTIEKKGNKLTFRFKKKYNKGWKKYVCGRAARKGKKGKKFNYDRPCKSGEWKPSTKPKKKK